MKAHTKFILAALVTAALAACNAAPRTEADKQELEARSKAELQVYISKDSSIQGLIDKSVGYVVFPSVGKGAWFIGGSYGKGEVFTKTGGKLGYADITEVSAGFTWGAQDFSELLIFMRQDDFDSFKKGDFSVGANASAVLLNAGAAGKTDPSKGVIAFIDAKGGVMAEASVSGQRLRFHAEP